MPTLTTLRHSVLACGLLSLLLAALAGEVRGATGGRVHAPQIGIPDYFDDFGRLVDVSGEKVIVASQKRVSIFDLGTDQFEAQDLLVGTSQPVKRVLDVEIDGDVAAVLYSIVGSVSNAVARFVYTGTHWGKLGTKVTNMQWIELHEGRFIGVSPSLLTVADPMTFAVLESQPTPAGEVLNVAAGSDLTPGPRLIAVAVHSPEGMWTVFACTFGSQTLSQFVLAGELPAEFGAIASGLDVHGGRIFYSVDVLSRVAVLEKLPGGEFVSQGPWVIGKSGGSSTSGFGREVAASDVCTAISILDAALLPDGGPGVGAIELARTNEHGFEQATGEVLHSFDTDFTTPDDFGASLAIDADLLVTGEPGTEAFQWQVVASTPAIATQQFPGTGVAGIHYVPTVSLIGYTQPGSPLAFEVILGAPSSTAYVVLGLTELSAPFKGGVLVPNPDVILELPTTQWGMASALTTWPDVGPIGFTLYGQVWFVDPDGPEGLTASDGFSLQQF